ncbi:MAG: hypothetical protein ACRYGK_13450 [Janthinobacterium lividum]
MLFVPPENRLFGNGGHFDAPAMSLYAQNTYNAVEFEEGGEEIRWT